MKRILTAVVTLVATLSLLAISNADAQGRTGKGQGLRDGSCGSATTSTQTKAGKTWNNRNGQETGQKSGTGNRLGDGTNPRPLDGTGFGFGAQRN
jgi:hypothetical protein